MATRCAICRDDKDVVLEDRALGRYGCRRCNHSFTVVSDDRRTAYTDDYYRTHANWFEHPNYRLFNFIYSRAIVPAKRPVTRVLDAGCGTGDLLKYLRKKDLALDLYGIDLHRNTGDGITFIEGDVLRKELTMRFEVVTSLAAIEHVEDINLFVERLKGLLVPSGLLVIMTDNTGGAFYGAARLLKRLGIETPYKSLYELAHLHHFTNASFRRLLEAHGLEVILQRNHNYPLAAVNLPPCGAVMRAVYRFGAGLLFALPPSFGILQTVVCRVRGSQSVPHGR